MNKIINLKSISEMTASGGGGGSTGGGSTAFTKSVVIKFPSEISQITDDRNHTWTNNTMSIAHNLPFSTLITYTCTMATTNFVLDTVTTNDTASSKAYAKVLSDNTFSIKLGTNSNFTDITITVKQALTPEEQFNADMTALVDSINTKSNTTTQKTIKEMKTAVDGIAIAKSEEAITVTNITFPSDPLVISPTDSSTVISQVKINKPSTLLPENIVTGTSICGVTGTCSKELTASTETEMNEFLLGSSINLGKVVKYIGTTTTKYEKDAFYLIEQEVI